MFQRSVLISFALLTAPLRGESFHFPKTRPGELAQELIRLCESPTTYLQGEEKETQLGLDTPDLICPTS